MRVKVTQNVGGLARDLAGISTRARPELKAVVRDEARAGNRHAKRFASEQHTMFSDVDKDYPAAFTVEQIGPLAYEYGPDDSKPQGSKASGYEFGSVNQASPHRNLDRSVDLVRVQFPKAVSAKARDLFRKAGF